MFWDNLKSSKKVSYEVADNLGLQEEEKQGIEVNKDFEDFVVTIESINQLLLRDEREAAFNVFKKNEKQTLYGLTLELPLPVSTDFYALLEKFKSTKPHAIDIRPFDIEYPKENNSEKVEVVVEENLEAVQNVPIEDTLEDGVSSPEALIAEKEAEIKRLRKQISQSDQDDKAEEKEYEELAKSIVKPTLSTSAENQDHINIFDESSEELSSDEKKGQCSQCGFENVEGARFCSYCGNNLSGLETTVDKEVPLPLEVLDEKVLEELPSEFAKLFSLKEGWNIRPKIEHEVALEFEMKKDGILKKVQEKVETQKKDAIEKERQKFKEKETKISSEYAEKLTNEKNNAVIKMEQDKKDEIEKRIDLRRQYLNQWYRSGLAQLDGKQPIQEPLQVEG